MSQRSVKGEPLSENSQKVSCTRSLSEKEQQVCIKAGCAVFELLCNHERDETRWSILVDIDLY